MDEVVIIVSELVRAVEVEEDRGELIVDRVAVGFLKLGGELV